MKSKIKILLIATIVLSGVNVYMSKNNDTSILKQSLSLLTVEKLAFGEITIGPWGTNWADEWQMCTITTKKEVWVGVPGFGGVKKIVEVTETVQKTVCASGGGTCISPAGCSGWSSIF